MITFNVKSARTRWTSMVHDEDEREVGDTVPSMARRSRCPRRRPEHHPGRGFPPMDFNVEVGLAAGSNFDILNGIRRTRFE